MIRLEDAEDGATDTRSRGLHVSTRDLAVGDSPQCRYIDVAFRDDSGHEAVSLIATELAQLVGSAGMAPATALQRVLAKWRRFWELTSADMLSRERIIGLFGELWFLLVWLGPSASMKTAIHRWRGPSGSRHDFEWSGRSVEVKTTARSGLYVHRIHGVDQLAEPESGQLLLFSLRVREEGGASNSLPRLVEQVRAAVQDDAEARAGFEERLSGAGFSASHAETYERVRLRVVDAGLYEVSDAFPRIVPTGFRAPLPAAVFAVEYDIDMAAASSWRLTSVPDEASDLLG